MCLPCSTSLPSYLSLSQTQHMPPVLSMHGMQFTPGLTLLRVCCRPEGSAEQTAGRPTTPELPNGTPLCTPRRLAAKPPSAGEAAGPPTPMQPPNTTRRNDASPGGRSAGQFTCPRLPSRTFVHTTL